MASIAFVNPAYGPGHFSRASRSPAVTKSGTVYYPLWLCYAAGWAEQHGHSVRILDAAARMLPHDAVVRVLAAAPPDLLVLDTTTPSIASDLRLARLLREALPASRILAASTHASALPEEVLKQEPAVDAVARGEYDITVTEYAGALDAPGKVAGLSWRDGERIVHNPDRELIEDLDRLPFVSRVYKKHLDVGDYFWSTALYPMVMLITGRGCPNRCAWCLYPQTMHGRRLRFRTAANVVDEFEYIRKELPEVREIGIEDDTFSCRKEHARSVCELLLSRNVRARWWANVRADLDFEDMRLMKRAGCRLFIVGFEAGTQETLEAIHKGITIDDIERFMQNAKRLRAPVRACFVVGQIGETMETMRATLDLALRLDPETAQFFPMIAYPGTEAYRWASEHGYLATDDYAQWLADDGTHNPVVKTEQLSPEAVRAFVDYATRRFYLRPRVLLRTAWRALTSWQEAKRILRVMRRFGRYLFK